MYLRGAQEALNYINSSKNHDEVRGTSEALNYISSDNNHDDVPEALQGPLGNQNQPSDEAYEGTLVTLKELRETLLREGCLRDVLPWDALKSAAKGVLTTSDAFKVKDNNFGIGDVQPNETPVTVISEIIATNDIVAIKDLCSLTRDGSLKHDGSFGKKLIVQGSDQCPPSHAGWELHMLAPNPWIVLCENRMEEMMILLQLPVHWTRGRLERMIISSPAVSTLEIAGACAEKTSGESPIAELEMTCSKVPE
ncbi:hypothetical protein F4604DRAFT_1674801 [Suillus subluteus]|nr:hypothetical protein F4604DRAFT_1674801 [Suillus subluteus]